LGDNNQNSDYIIINNAHVAIVRMLLPDTALIVVESPEPDPDPEL
jgi:hypothetical protein